jgi:ATP-dependent DNA ligase
MPRPRHPKLWLHEVKHDGFRVIARKNGKRVRLYSWPGNDLTWRRSKDERPSSPHATASPSMMQDAFP